MIDIRQHLKNGGVAVGSWVQTCSPVVAELMSAAGFDFMVIDTEHSAVDLPQTQVLFQAIKAGNRQCAPLVRLPCEDYPTVKRYLDSGAAGVIAPLINTARQAEGLVAAVKYPPQGRRGVGFCRANQYGMDFAASVASANDQTFVCVQIEHIDGVANIDAILSVPGVDAAMIGPYDLSASMGMTGQFSNPRFQAATAKILDACKKHGAAPGLHIVQPDMQELSLRHQEGYRFIAYAMDVTMLSSGCKTSISQIKSLPGRKQEID